MKTLLWLIFAHFVCDFLLQSREIAKNKSSNPIYLLKHMGILWIGFFFFTILIPDKGGVYTAYHPMTVVIFVTINTLVHGFIDGNIWNLYKWYRKPEITGFNLLKKEFAYWEDSLFYWTLGFDQFLHIATIVVLYFKVLS